MANLFFIGDSMIEFFDWQQRFPEHRVVNLGRSGETTSELLARLDTILALQPPPDWLLLMTGTNDVCMEDFTFPSVLDQIIDSCIRKLPETIITVNSLLPINLPYLAADVVPRVNAILEELAASQNVNFLNGHQALTDPSGLLLPGVLSADGVHIEDRGYRLWADEVDKQLQAILT
ncbi:MAG: GDSL-type esterase/lipase family protein [Desulfobulbaceae bacterium]|nr:GDSL-type esterase/lipase family protein [Desulfobulbaceae bacterium]